MPWRAGWRRRHLPICHIRTVLLASGALWRRRWLTISSLSPGTATLRRTGFERQLWTPLGLRTLAPGAEGYTPRYEGGIRERDGAYHQGTVWPWLLGPFVDAWVRVRGGGADVRTEARRRFFQPLLDHLSVAGVGHISEIADADPPHTPRGCPFQAWSVGEALRLDRLVLEAPEAPQAARRQRAQPVGG